MSGCPRSGHGAMIRIGGPKDTKCVPMELLSHSRQLNSYIEPKARNHQGPPKAVVGSGGFNLTKKRA